MGIFYARIGCQATENQGFRTAWYGDQTVGPEQVKVLLSACNAKNIPYTHREYGNAEHPLYHVFHVTVQEPMGQKCNDDECEFFRKQINK